MAGKTNGFIFTWKIENYSMLPHQNGESLNSSVFESTTCEGVKFHLLLYPSGFNRKEDDAACALRPTRCKSNVKLKFYFVLQSTENSDAIVSNTLDYSEEISEHIIGNFFNINEMYANKHIYLPRDTLTLRCHLIPVHEARVEAIAYNLDSKCSSLVIRSVCRSGIHVRRRSGIWSIQNVSKLELVEKSFIGALSNLPDFKLSIKFGNKTSEFVPIEIRLTDHTLEKGGTFVKCKITVISTNKGCQDSKESTHFFAVEPHVWQFPPFLKASNLTRDKYLCMDDTLHLQCDFAYSYKKDALYEVEDICMPLTFESIKNDVINEHDLRTSLKKCCSSGEYCDIQLRAGGKTFQGHRVVLGARSTVFNAMFENDMIEKNSGVVNIVDVDPTTLQRMLSFLYDDVLNEDLSPEDVCKLYEAADKYDISSLKYRCWVSLISSLSVDKVCDFLVLADAHQDSFLLSAVYNFIYNHADETFRSSYWRSLMDENTKLAAEVMHKMLTEKNLL